MSQQGVQKLKLLYIAQFLYKYTNEKTCLSTSKIIDMLSEREINAERKSIYSDIETLKDFGVDIENVRSKTGGFKLKSRTFQLAELKLLVDAVQSSRFITERKN